MLTSLYTTSKLLNNVFIDVTKQYHAVLDMVPCTCTTECNLVERSVPIDMVINLGGYRVVVVISLYRDNNG